MMGSSSRKWTVPIWVVIAAAAMVVALATSLGVGTAWAGDDTRYTKYLDENTTIYTFYVPDKQYEEQNHIRIESDDRGEIKVVSMNKKKVEAKVTQEYWYATPYTVLDITLKKAGTSKVVFTEGKKTYTVKIKAYEWSFPVKELTIGGKSYVSEMKESFYDGWWGHTVINTSDDLYGKQVLLTPEDGWKVTMAHDVMRNKKVKNGAVLNDHDLQVDCKYKKIGFVTQLHIFDSQYN